MKKHITDEKTGISYTLYGDYYLPDLELPAEEERPSEYGDSDICGISVSTARRFIPGYSSTGS